MKIVKDFDLLSPKWLDIIFEKRNKQYGAYELRNDSSNRHIKALIIVFIVGLLAIFLPKIVATMEFGKKDTKETSGIEVTEFTEPEAPEEPIAQPEDAPPPPPLVKSIQVTTYQIADNDNVDPSKQITAAEIDKIDAVIAAQTNEGDPEGKTHIDDVEKVKVITAEPETIHDFVEKMPEFPGGQKALMKWLNENIEYPYLAQEMGIQGKVYVNFIVRPDGSIDGINIKRGVHQSLDKEAARLVKAMPKWMPGRQNGNAVSVYYTLPVSFILKQ